MEIETDSVISEDHKKSASKFGIQLSDLSDPKKYIIAFLKRLLLYREKIDRNLFQPYLNPKIEELWQEVLSNLEDVDRKLANILTGSLVFTLFCPTKNSSLQLQDEKWRIGLQQKVNKLLNALGMSLND